MRGNAGERELSSSFAGITLIRFYGYDLSLALSLSKCPSSVSGQTPRELYSTKLRKKVLKPVTFIPCFSYYSKFNHYEGNPYFRFIGRLFNCRYCSKNN